MAETTTGRDILRDIVVEAVNAKDPDLFSLADEIRISEDTLDRVLQVMERWPRLMLSRGELGVEPVAMMWQPDDELRYVPGGYIEFYVEDGAARIEIVDDVPEDLISEPPPGLEVAEWEDADAVGEGWAPDV